MKRNVWIYIFFFMFGGCGSGVNDLTFTGLCDGYTDYTESPYVVPWSVGVTQTIGQGNCGSATHNGRVKYAYDVSMDIGTTIVAARAGRVYEVVQDKSDGNGCAGGENHIFIQHADGTVAKYLHLTINGSMVTENTMVTRGQAIGLSGNTGCSGGPHLHFEVNYEMDGGMTIPITFRNVGANTRGLQVGKSYTAE